MPGNDSIPNHDSIPKAFRTSEGRDHGLTPRQVRGRRFDHPFHGVTSVGLGDGILHRCRSFEPNLLRGQLFSHTTALRLHGVSTPDDREPFLHVSVAWPRTPPRGVGVRGHSLRRTPVTMVFGLPVATPESAWCQAAAVLSREQLVAAGDALVTGRRSHGRRLPSLTSVGDLADEADRHVRSPGGTRMSWALARIRPGVGSPQETLLRLALVRFRLPEPSTDVEVRTALGIFHADLGYPHLGVAIEYEGDGHREREQWMRDIQRREAMEDAGWRVIRVVAADLRPDPRALVDRVRRILSNRASLSSRGHTKGKLARPEAFRR